MRARGEGDSWATIERRFGVSARQARRIVKDLGTASITDTTAIDPTEIVGEALLRYEATIEQLAEIADCADDPMVALNAIGAQIRVTERQLELLQNAGLLPTPVSTLAHQVDAGQVAQRAVEVLNQHRVPRAVKAELVAVLRGIS